MDDLLKIAPILNTIIIVGVGMLTVLRVRDAVQKIEQVSHELQQTVVRLDKRLTVIETLCKINHPHSSLMLAAEKEIEAMGE